MIRIFLIANCVQSSVGENSDETIFQSPADTTQTNQNVKPSLSPLIQFIEDIQMKEFIIGMYAYQSKNCYFLKINRRLKYYYLFKE